jgi:hypothetical protein
VIHEVHITDGLAMADRDTPPAAPPLDPDAEFAALAALLSGLEQQLKEDGDANQT